MEVEGTLHEIQIKEFEWRIYDFSSLTKLCVESPSFSFAGETWHLELFPNGSIEHESSGFLDIFLCRMTPGHPIKLKYSLGLKTEEGDKDQDYHFSHVFDEETFSWGVTELLSRSDLYETAYCYLPSGVLTVFCTLQYPTEGEGNAGIVRATEKLAISEKPVATEKPAATEKLCNALKQILLSGDHSDTTIKVKGEDFKLHKNILGALSPYFDLMFKNEMKENNTGIVTIDDCEPDTFRSYINFLYTGKVDHISAENVCDLYTVADKYHDDQLKEECLQFMMNSISIESLCDYMILAVTYEEQTLLNNAIKIFACKTKEIIKSVKWLSFLTEYPIQANELLIKALDHDSAS